MTDDEGLAVQFRWLGVAGVELTAGAQVLAVDPFFTRPPRRLTDYRMDACFSFLIRAGPYRILHGAAPVPADLWLTVPTRRRGRNAELLRVIRPKLVVPIHWDDLFRPLSRPIRPLSRPIRPLLGPAGRAELALPRTALAAPVFRPEIFRVYRLAEVIDFIGNGGHSENRHATGGIREARNSAACHAERVVPVSCVAASFQRSIRRGSETLR
ncbi:MAG: hypothetical protein NT169_19965 [Chloroflexi bacterium]|nr:hypothetical protein [Chloroflexota bacterium]